jgi:hypothetical protein
MIGYKLFRQRKDGSLGPLFIDARKRIEIGVKYPFEDHPTKGYAHRPGWHICSEPVAPHLSKKGRVWARVRFTKMATIKRPKAQGGVWYLGSDLTVLEIC